jgi:radical SAM-linked protein
MERLRLKFSRGDEIKFISHLDIMRLWERAMRRANLPLMYSEGFTPHPRLSLAAPLSLGVTSDAELMDAYFGGQVSPQYMQIQIVRQMPAGITIHDIWAVGMEMPSLQAQVRFAEYMVTLKSTEGKSSAYIEQTITNMLAARDIPWQHIRDKSVRTYNLRSLINDISLTEYSNEHTIISMKLRCDPGGSGRPEQIIKALGFSQRPQVIHRTALIFS